MTKRDIISLIENDAWMMDILRTVKTLNLPDWWIGGGFIRSKVWDTLHGHTKRTPLPDIDVVYFDKNDFTDEEARKKSTKQEAKLEKTLKKQYPTSKWSVTNQARAHHFHGHKQYRNINEALSNWVETATCIGVKIDESEKVSIIAPHGIHDLVHLILRPTSVDTVSRFKKRQIEKQWLKKWPKLKIEPNVKYTVYILQCADSTYYVGCTNNLEKRLIEHNISKNGAHYTKIRRPVVLIHTEAFDTLLAARGREAEIKRLSRKEKEMLLK